MSNPDSEEPGPTDAGPTVSLGELRVETEARLRSSGVDNHRAEALWLLEEVTGLDPAELNLALDSPATVGHVGRLDALVARRVAGEPLQYVLGHWPFRRLDLVTDARALIPRPETESVVEVALGELDRLVGIVDAVGEGSARRNLLAVDLGCGTGAIALSLASERQRVAVVATDRSEPTLALARANLAGLGAGAERVILAAGSWWDALDPALRGAIDLVVSNPPYVPDDAPLPAVVEDWEPTGALRAGPDGLDDVRVIVSGAVSWLRPGGALVVEIGDEQGDAALALAHDAGLVDTALHQDLTGRTRVLSALR